MQLPQRDPERMPSAGHAGAMNYKIDIPLLSPRDDLKTRKMFYRWIWYAARRDGLHLDEAEDDFDDPVLIAEGLHSVVAPVLRLDSAQQQALTRFCTIARYGAGELIQADGDVPEAVSFILSGQVLLTADTDGSRRDVDTLERGSFLGHSALIRHPVTGSAFAVDEVTVIRVAREGMEDVVTANPALLQEFGRAIDERRARVLNVLAEKEVEQTSAG